MERINNKRIISNFTQYYEVEPQRRKVRKESSITNGTAKTPKNQKFTEEYGYP